MISVKRLDQQKLERIFRSISDLYRPTRLDAFPAHLVAVIETFFGSEIVSYNEFKQGKTPLVHSNNGFEKSHAKLLTDCTPFLQENPLIAKLLREGEVVGSRVSDEMPWKDFQATTIYNELYRTLDADYQMACGFDAGRDDVFIGIALNQKSRDFKDGELEAFRLMIPHIRQAYQICYALEQARMTASVTTLALNRHRSGVIGFDDQHRIFVVSPLAEALALRLFKCHPHENSLLPDALRNCVQALAVEPTANSLNPSRSLRYLLDDGSHVVLSLSFDPERLRHCLIFEQERIPGTAAQLQALALSRRQTEICFWTIHRKTSWEIGRILGLSPGRWKSTSKISAPNLKCPVATN